MKKWHCSRLFSHYSCFPINFILPVLRTHPYLHSTFSEEQADVPLGPSKKIVHFRVSWTIWQKINLKCVHLVHPCPAHVRFVVNRESLVGGFHQVLHFHLDTVTPPTLSTRLNIVSTVQRCLYYHLLNQSLCTTMCIQNHISVTIPTRFRVYRHNHHEGQSD